MPKRSLDENLEVLLEAVRNAGDQGITVAQVKQDVFSDTNFSNTDIKKLLEHLRTKGLIQSKVGKLDMVFKIIPGR